MEYRHLGSSGLLVSALSFGAWVTFGDQIGEDVAYECMQAASAAGVNYFDNAESYGGGQAEILMGNVIKRAGWKRQELVLSTKIFWGNSFVQGPNSKGLSRKHLLEGVEGALARLQVDYLDLVFCHRPDIQTPIEETVRAMSYLVDHGKALYWGTSEWTAQQIQQAYDIARREHLAPPTMEQPQYNMFHREKVEREFAPLYREFGLGTTVWSPLASGLLTGKYSKGIPKGTRVDLPGYEWLREQFESPEGQQRIAKVRELTPIAQELGCTMAQLAIAWCLKNPHVSTVITGASKPSQVTENVKALDVVPKLTDDVMERIENVLGNRPPPEPDYRD
jgi:voltage-dependent potassium channel beta subunit